ncbi:hypothetical protein NMY22_g18771 [Coprinellus aureogranulatus]|nr:hypothetical protein NMY22_g18771 [Coprinellus aureogranulatus]
MKDGLDLQRDIDVRIVQLQLETLDLKRRRNGLSLIPSLPVDIMAARFPVILTSLRPEKRRKEVLTYVRLNYVSHT